jgi:hypothetical protein
MMSGLTTITLTVWFVVLNPLIVPAIVVIAGRFNLPRTMVVVARGAARTSEHTCRKTKDSCDQEASGNASKIFHGTVSKGRECERKRAAYPYCQPCEPVTGRTSEPLRKSLSFTVDLQCDAVGVMAHTDMVA